MKKFRILPMVLLSALSLLAAGGLAAHTDLAEAMPAPDSVLSEAPEALKLRFTAPVELVQADIEDAAGEAVETGFTPPEMGATEFVVPLPALKAGRYTVEWTVVGVEDEHTMLGDFSFTVSGSSAAKAE